MRSAVTAFARRLLLLLRERPVACAIAAVAMVYVVTLSRLPTDGMWTLDNSSKLLQVQALAASGFRSAELSWAGRALASETHCNPIPYPFGIVTNGRLQSIYSPVFALISAVPFLTIGVRGLAVVPLLATIMMLIGVARLARRLGAGRTAQAWAVVATGLATPIWFYAVTFWEHNVATAFVVWSLVMALDHGQSRQAKHVVWAAVSGAAAVYFRDDLYLYLPLLMGALWWTGGPAWRQRAGAGAVFVLVATVSLVPLWVLNHAYTGRVFGLHLVEHFASHPDEQFAFTGGILGHLRERPAIVHHLLTAVHPAVPVALLFSIPMVVLLIWVPRTTLAQSYLILPLVALWAALPPFLALWSLSGGNSPVAHLVATNSLFYAAPFIAVGCIRTRAYAATVAAIPGSMNVLPRIVLAHAVLYALLAPQVSNAAGIHWGNRFLEHAYPVLAVLAIVNIARVYVNRAELRRVGFLVIALVLSLSVSLQAYSVNLLSRTASFFVRLNDAVLATQPAVVLTDTWWMPLQLYRVFPVRPVFLVNEPGCWQHLEAKLGEAGIDRVLDVRWDRGRGPAGPGAARVGDEGLDFYGSTLETKSLRDFRWRSRSSVPWDR